MSCSTDGLRGGFDAMRRACLRRRRKQASGGGRTEGGRRRGKSVRPSDLVTGCFGRAGSRITQPTSLPSPYDRRNIGEQMWWMMPKSHACTVSKLHEKWDINQGQMSRFASCAIKIPRHSLRPSIQPSKEVITNSMPLFHSLSFNGALSGQLEL